MWCVLKSYDGDIFYTKIFNDYSSARSHAEHIRNLLNFHWTVSVVSLHPASVEVVDKVVNGKRAAISQKKIAAR